MTGDRTPMMRTIMMPHKFRIALAATLVALTLVALTLVALTAVSVVDSASAAKLAVAVVLAADNASAYLRPPLARRERDHSNKSKPPRQGANKRLRD